MIKIFFSDEQILKYLKEKGYRITEPEQQKKFAQKARDTRSKNIQQKIQKAIKELEKQGKDINPYSISRVAEINYRTARKYFQEVFDESNRKFEE